MLIAKKLEKPSAAPHRVSAIAAGYLELEGAQKDGDCAIVEVKNGISKDRGCCNLWDSRPKADKFSCGTCTFER